jgi:hypothetical protein
MLRGVKAEAADRHCGAVPRAAEGDRRERAAELPRWLVSMRCPWNLEVGGYDHMMPAAGAPVSAAPSWRGHQPDRAGGRAGWRFGLREGVLVPRADRIGEHGGGPWPLAFAHFPRLMPPCEGGAWAGYAPSRLMPGRLLDRSAAQGPRSGCF